MGQRFAAFATRVATATGSSAGFLLALLVIFLWAVCGPLFGFSDTWQLVINTGTTIVTFLMVFLIQNTQNRDATAIHVKLDEIIHAMSEADEALIGAEEASDERLAELKAHYHQLLEQHNALLARVGEEPVHSAWRDTAAGAASGIQAR
jgi:low affinity Fe/Cu permease